MDTANASAGVGRHGMEGHDGNRQLVECVAHVAPYLGFDGFEEHLRLARCCRGCCYAIQRHYATTRALSVGWWGPRAIPGVASDPSMPTRILGPLCYGRLQELSVRVRGVGVLDLADIVSTCAPSSQLKRLRISQHRKMVLPEPLGLSRFVRQPTTDNTGSTTTTIMTAVAAAATRILWTSVSRLWGGSASTTATREGGHCRSGAADQSGVTEGTLWPLVRLDSLESLCLRGPPSAILPPLRLLASRGRLGTATLRELDLTVFGDYLPISSDGGPLNGCHCGGCCREKQEEAAGRGALTGEHEAGIRGDMEGVDGDDNWAVAAATFAGLERVKLSGEGCSRVFLCHLSASCSSVLRELTLREHDAQGFAIRCRCCCRRSLEAGGAPIPFNALQSVDFTGPYSSRFFAVHFSFRCAATLTRLALVDSRTFSLTAIGGGNDDPVGAVGGADAALRVPTDIRLVPVTVAPLPRLSTLVLLGDFASTWLPSVSALGTSSLEELTIGQISAFGSDSLLLSGEPLPALRTVDLSGGDLTSQWFSSIVAHRCASSLQSLRLVQLDSRFVRSDQRAAFWDFTALQTIELDGDGAVEFLAAVCQSCLHSLRDITIRQRRPFAAATAAGGGGEAASSASDYSPTRPPPSSPLRGATFQVLDRVQLDGPLASAFFLAALAPSCRHSLRELRMWEREEYCSTASGLVGGHDWAGEGAMIEFDRLEVMHLNGRQASRFRLHSPVLRQSNVTRAYQ
eukprot:GHVU01134157.1.p1 GENE.GHVU01134157.1~~GHVU01134157.1.p1  ORF type:complete len:742 (-),score=78.45 GHVU01134157.1:243-2468(-)